MANKIRNDEDRKAIETFCAQHGMAIIGVVPQDEALIEAERQALSPFDFARDGEGVTAIGEIADEIEVLAGSPQAGVNRTKAGLSPEA